jgi:hypothetical protein
MRQFVIEFTPWFFSFIVSKYQTYGNNNFGKKPRIGCESSGKGGKKGMKHYNYTKNYTVWGEIKKRLLLTS